MKNYGSLTYQGQTYKTVVIGTQTWMAENLNYNTNTTGSKCYNNDETNCTKYGRLYNWETAMTVCPSGWHLPSDSEWDALIVAVGGSLIAGKKLKADSPLWDNNGKGTDDFGFAALPGGYFSSNGRFEAINISCNLWVSTEYQDNPNYANFRLIGRSGNDVISADILKSWYYSVRCVQDD